MLAGALELQMSANIARLSKDIADAKAVVTDGMKSIESAVAAAKMALGSLGIGLSVAGIVAFVNKGIEAEAMLHRLALQTGITVETLSALKGVAKLAGTDLDTVAAMVNKLEKAMAQFAQNGAAKTAAAFGQLGYSQQQVREGLQDMDKFLPEFAKKLLETGVGGEQAGLAMELLGKSGAASLPFLKELAEQVRLVGKVTTEQAEAAHTFEQSLIKLKGASGGLAVALANELLPQLNAIAKAMLEAKTNGENFWTNLSRILNISIFGNDANRNQREMIDLTNQQLDLLNTISILKWRMANQDKTTGDAANMEANRIDLKAAEEALKAVNAQLGTQIAMRKVLEEDAVKAPAKANTPLAAVMDPESIKAAMELANALNKQNLANIRDAFAREEALTDAYHKAGLLSDADYFHAKRANLDIELDAEIKALQKNIAAQKTLKAGATTDAEKIRFNIKIMESDAAITKALLDGSVKRAKLSLDEQAAADAVLKIYQAMAAVVADLTRLQEANNAAIDAAVISNNADAAALQFEIDLIGKTAHEVEMLTAMRAIDLKLRQDIAALPLDEFGNFVQGGDEAFAKLTADAAAFKLRMRDLIDAKQIKTDFQSVADGAAAAWRSAGADIQTSLTKAFGAGGAAVGGMVKAFSDGIATQIELDKAFRDQQSKGGGATAEEARKYQTKTAENALDSWGSMAGAAASYFDQQSAAYKVLHGIEQAMFAAKLAMQVAEIAGNMAKSASAMTFAEVEIATLMAVGEAEAAVAVATQAQGDPYTAWARMAAMVAAMAALGFAVAGASGSSSAASAADIQKAQGTGTVLGDANAKSASIANALAEIAKTDAIGLTYSHEMLAALRSIDNAMTGLAALVYQTTGLTTGSGFDFEASVTKNKGDPIMGMLGITTPDILGPSFLGKLAQVLQGLWGKVTQSITDSGLLIAGTLGQLAGGSGVQQYANVHTDSSSFFGLVHDTSDSTLTGPLAERVNAQFALVFKNIGISIEAAAKALGLWTPSFVASMESLTLVLGKDGKISFNGLTGQDLTDAINAVFSSASDQIATAMLPGFEAFQKVGEGYYQTIIRVASQNEIVSQTLDTLGITLGATGMAAITARMDLVDLAGGIEEFGKLTSDYYSKYFSPAEQRANLGAQLGKEFSSLGIAMPTDVGAFRALVEGIDLSTTAGRELWTTLMKIAPSFYDFADQIVGLDGKLHSTADVLAQHISLQQALDVATGAKTQREVENENRRAQAMDAASLAIINATIAQEDANAIASTTADLNTTRRNLELQMLESLGLHEQAVAQARAQAIVGLTAEQIAIYDINAGMTEFIANAKKQAEQMAERRSLEVQLMAAQGNAAGALAAQRAIDIADMNAAQIALYDYNAALKAQIQTAKDAAAAAKEQGTLDQQLAVLRGEQTQQQVDRANAWTAALSAGARETLAAIWAEQDLAAARKTAAEVAAAQAALDDRLAVATGARTSQDVARAREWAAATTDQARATLVAIYAAEDAATAAKRWADALHALEQSAGVSFQGITDAIKKTLLGQMSQADLGTAMADMIVTGVYNAMATKAAEQVTNIIDQYLIAPIMSAILNGTSVTAAINAALTQANIDAMVTAATNAITALTAVFSNPAFIQAMDDLKIVIGGITSTIQSSLTTLGQVDPGHGPARAGLPGEIWIDTGGGYGYWTQDPNYLSPGGTTTSNAAQILNDRLSLLAEIYKLTGDAAGAAAVLEQQHAIALAAMDPSLRELQTQLWGLQKAAEAAARATALNDWLKSNAMSSTLSPLTAQQQLTEAQRQYADELRLAKAGDAKALGDITQYADALLAAEKAVEGFGGGYSALYAAIRADIGGLATANGMTAGESAIATNVVQLHTDVTDQTAVLARLLERQIEAITDQTAAVTDAVSTGAARQTAAATNALVVNARN